MTERHWTDPEDDSGPCCYGWVTSQGADHEHGCPRETAKGTPVADRDALRRPIADPNSVVPRGDSQTLTEWQTRAILASGAVQDAADVRRAVAEEIAAAIEGERTTPHPFTGRWSTKQYTAGLTRAARVARVVGGSDA